MNNLSRQDRAVAAAAAVASAISTQQRGTLKSLQGTLSKAAETSFRMSMRHSGSQAVRDLHGQQQQERQQHRQQDQQLEEKAYLQQHMEQLLREQPLDQKGHSHSGSAFKVPGAGDNSHVSNSASHPAGTEVTVSGLDKPAAAAAAETQLPCASGASGTASAVRMTSSADVARPAAAAAAAGMRQMPHRVHSAPPQDCVSSIAGSQSQRSSWGSGWGFGLRRGTRSDAHSQIDDRASLISSIGSGSSRRSLSQSVLGAIKSVQYSLVS
jgi:hypothetical protein